MNTDFWTLLQTLVDNSSLVIERKKNTTHPNFKELLYPLDYGYLAETHSSDNAELDIWLGSLEGHIVKGIICTVDLWKRDSEIKVLIDCTQEEIDKILAFHNASDSMKGILCLKE